MEEQADYGDKPVSKLCPVMSSAHGGWDCEREKCAWWTGTECAVVAIAKRGRGVDVKLTPPAVPGL